MASRLTFHVESPYSAATRWMRYAPACGSEEGELLEDLRRFLGWGRVEEGRTPASWYGASALLSLQAAQFRSFRVFYRSTLAGGLGGQKISVAATVRQIRDLTTGWHKTCRHG